MALSEAALKELTMTKLSAWLWNTKINSIPHWEVSETNYLSVVRQLERERPV